MSMHLAGHGLSTTSTRTRKSKLVINGTFMQEFHAYNKAMKRHGCHKTLEEYIQYRKGKASYTKKASVKLFGSAEPYRRPSPVVPSGIGIGVANPKRREQQYTGDKLMGIATMHKSNMVPVFKQEDAEEIARMRR